MIIMLLDLTLLLIEGLGNMTKQEIIDRLEQIADSMDMDFLNRHTIEGIVKDIKELQWKINIGVD